MSLLDNFPHECTIRRRTIAKGDLGGGKTSSTVEQTGVSCWVQTASDREVLAYEKMGMSINRKIYFLSDPSVTERHEILVTKKLGVAVSSPAVLEVRSEALPDASAGLGVVYRVMAEEEVGASD